MSVTESIQSPEFQDASSLYEPGPPILVGNFIMSRQQARAAPVSLDSVYQPAIETLQSDLNMAMRFAKRFGKLSVAVALDDAPTTFTLTDKDAPNPKIAQMKTVSQYLPSEFFEANEVDSQFTYLLCNDQPVTAELALIQALHMLDYAIVSKQFDGQMPLVKTASSEQLVRLQSGFPSTLLRTYGNVRNLSNAPTILGTVVPTDIFEKSGIETEDFVPKVQPASLNSVPNSVDRQPAAAIGITTAKRPHIGHGFLLVKAIATAGEGGTVVVELNDLGPRVAKAVSALAQKTGCSIEQAIGDIVDAEVSPTHLEAAYQSRENAPLISLPSDFALTASNAFYSRLLNKLCPPSNTLLPIANSSQTMKSLTRRLISNPKAQGLFGNDGMVLFGDEIATVVQQYGEPTLPGIIGALATGFELTMVDSPTPIDRIGKKNFAEAGIPVNLTEGIGINFDFEVASGTKGEAPSLQSIMAMVEPSKVPLLLRSLLNSSVFVRGDGKSLNPNFASSDVLSQKIAALLNTDLSGTDLYQPFEFKDITRQVSRDLTPYYRNEGLPPTGKISSEEIKQSVSCLPALQSRLSPRLLDFVAQQDVPTKVPKNLISQQDANLINKIRSAEPMTVFGLLSATLDLQPELIDLLPQTQIGSVMEAMGYTVDELQPFLQKLTKSGGLYVLE